MSEDHPVKTPKFSSEKLKQMEEEKIEVIQNKYIFQLARLNFSMGQIAKKTGKDRNAVKHILQYYRSKENFEYNGPGQIQLSQGQKLLENVCLCMESLEEALIRLLMLKSQSKKENKKQKKKQSKEESKKEDEEQDWVDDEEDENDDLLDRQRLEQGDRQDLCLRISNDQFRRRQKRLLMEMNEKRLEDHGEEGKQYQCVQDERRIISIFNDLKILYHPNRLNLLMEKEKRRKLIKSKYWRRKM